MILSAWVRRHGPRWVLSDLYGKGVAFITEDGAGAYQARAEFNVGRRPVYAVQQFTDLDGAQQWAKAFAEMEIGRDVL